MTITTPRRPAAAARLARRRRMAAGAAALCASAAGLAAEIDTGMPDLTLRWDNTVRYNIATRVEKIDPAIGTSATTDESDNRFGRGKVVNNRIDWFSELEDLIASLDPTIRIVEGGERIRRGHTNGPIRVALPAGYLDHLDDLTVPDDADVMALSGG